MNDTKLQLEAGKFYRTRDGKKAYVCGSLGANPFTGQKKSCPVQGYIEGHGQTSWTEQGGYVVGEDNGYDLIAKWVEPKRIKGWIAIGGSDFGTVQTSHCLETKTEACGVFEDDYRRKPLACIEIDVLEGQGLEGEAGR